MTTYILTDVDGVFTDGKFTYTKKGKEAKVFGPHDADGIKILRAAGVKIFAITGDRRGFDISKKRLSDMKIQLFFKNERDRHSWALRHFNKEDLIFVGDGAFDVPLLRDAALSFAPASATHAARHAATTQLSVSGGDGVFFEVAMWMLLYFFSPTEIEKIKKIMHMSDDHLFLLRETYREVFSRIRMMEN